MELSKYNLDELVISRSPAIEQWAFFLLHAHSYEAGELRYLLPAVQFQRAIDVIETIAEKSEAETPTNELTARDSSELDRLLTDLQNRLRQRDA